MIEIQNLRKDFAHDEIIKELNLAIHPGETLGLWGRPKTGLTTLMHLMAGILTPTTGRVLIDDRHAVVDRPYVTKVLSYVPEKLALPAGMRVRDILHFAASLRGLTNPRSVAQNLNEKFQLQDCWDLRFGYLPPSLQKLVCVAQALIHEPKILLLDEPLQPRDSWQKQRLLQWLKDPTPYSIRIISSHVLEDLAPLCGRILVLHEGRLVHSYTSEQLQTPQQMQAALHIAAEGGGI
ncbi:ATP-binding cassette domain-containing protein [Oligoflexus tunisiensis]|uniref:ATP-binding cassette domain-containing protein n=1 Tax=Oligoflexus tunisiensis TaxID=708132 RepID=UPI000AA5A79A|nr:ABC transporter ATP-binding protein [Oligoflexus tunisiensis]